MCTRTQILGSSRSFTLCFVFPTGSCLPELCNFKVLNFPSGPTFRLQKRTTREQAIRWSTFSAFIPSTPYTHVYICQNPSILILHLVIFGGETGQVGEKEGKGWMIVKYMHWRMV